MKKLLIVIALIFVIIGVNVMLSPVSPLKKEAIHIAVVGPMSNQRGEAIQKGTELYKEMINAQGGINGRRLEFIYFDDKAHPGIAEKIAFEIADENKSLLVLGHYNNMPSYVAGKIYKANEIPAITASATAEYVTSGNEWSFRVVPSDIMEAVFVANYIVKGMKSFAASIIFTNDSYGISLSENFEKTCKSLGIRLKKKWEWDMAKDSDAQLKKILKELKADDPGILFMATHSAQGAKIVTALKDGGKKHSIIGSYAFARSFFIEMKKYPREWSDPGYYSDGIYFVSPYISSIGGAETYRFTGAFYEKYNEFPSEISACYYDAAHVAVQAIKKIGIQSSERIREDRRKIRDMLENFYSGENAVEGVTGQIWFDENGNTEKHFVVGTWQRQKQIPAFIQYQHSASATYTDLTKKALDGEIIMAGGVVMNDIRIVYVSADNIRINSLDTEDSVCTLEFDLIFRYSGYFDDTGIEFNSVSPIRLGKPFSEKTEGDMTTRKYRVKGNFKCDFDFAIYPFDSQVIMIRFRHTTQTSDELIYVSGAPFPGKKGSLPGWKILQADLYQNILKKNSTLGNPKFFDSPHVISYSQFNIQIQIQRKAPVLVFIYFLSITSMLVTLLYVIRFIGPDRLQYRMLILMAVLVVCTGCHLFSSISILSVEYLTPPDCFFMLIYLLTAIFAFISVFSYRRYMKKKENIKPGLWIKG